MATIPSNAHGVRYLNNLAEYGNGYGIPLVSELTMFISQAIADPGEIIYAARFHVVQSNGIRLYSPEITYNGVGEVTYNFGQIQKNWITQNESMIYVSVGWEVRTNVSNGTYQGYEYFYHGWYGIGSPILDYSLPLINSYNAARTLVAPTIVDYAIDCVVSPLSTNAVLKNFLKYKVQYFNGSWIDAIAFVTALDIAYSSILNHSLPYLESQSYQTRVVIQDKFNTLFAYDVLPTTLVPLSIGKFGIGVGKVIEHEDAALDIEGKVYKNNLLQPTLFKKKPTEPDPEGIEDGDLLFIYNDLEAFSSTNFPQSFGESFIWGHDNTSGVWYTDFNYWTSLASSNNSMIESFEASVLKGANTPSLIFVNNGDCYFMSDVCLPALNIIKFNGKVKFNYFNLSGWNQDHEPKNSPKSFAFFGSNDGHTWEVIYDTSTFADTYKTTIRQVITNANYYEYLKIVWRTNQDNNSGNTTNATMIAVAQLRFEVEGYKYV